MEREYETMAQALVNDGALVDHASEVLPKSARIFHHGLYAGILKNAGDFRKATDPYAGAVSFGGRRPQRLKMRFSGSPPEDISDDLGDAFSVLQDTDAPKAASIEFYMRFNRVHPFYDANGRISRLIVTIYLHTQGWYIDWEALDRKKKEFLRRMNKCHKRAPAHVDYYDEDLYRTYFDIVLSFWTRYIHSIDSLNE
ncbi:hypothetical protein CRI93_09715 [Longimonas halophila]|uniref:Fido domain-containing protein n=2 Tax=Longimonas halophila TaxID=1469170 RepID=A0A2H3NWQ1_9BACT|nr:hypothetical protein CRI93_09715 [Longimonas halophila]